MRRKELAKKIMMGYEGRDRGFSGFLVWTGKSGSWDFTPNTAAIMVNNGRNIHVTKDVLEELKMDTFGKSVLALDYFLKMAKEITVLNRRGK